MDLSMEQDEFLKKVKRYLGDAEFEYFQGKLKRWQERPYLVQEFCEETTKEIVYINNMPEAREQLGEWIVQGFPNLVAEGKRNEREKRAKEEKIRIRETALRKSAYECQSGMILSGLPREVRDTIWGFLTKDDVIHISMDLEKHDDTACEFDPSECKYHVCTSSQGYSSTASPPGIGDHASCSTSGPSNYGAWRLTCRQMYLEAGTFSNVLKQNALQFSEPVTAQKFLFGLTEEVRAGIRHLRLALPYPLSYSMRFAQQQEGYAAWEAICNYFSNPWDRKTLGMDRGRGESVDDLKLPIYFYYSMSYFTNDSERLGKAWQVGRGNSSWHVYTSNLIYKGHPRLDIAICGPPTDLLDQEMRTDIDMSPSAERIDALRLEWPLLQFRYYQDLKLDIYHPEEEQMTTKVAAWWRKERLRMEKWTEYVKDEVRGGPGGVQGPTGCVFFAGQPYGVGDYLYSNFQ